MSYSIYEAKTKLSELLRAVRRGRVLTITDRGRPVARLVPIEAATDDELRFAELIAAGIVAPSTGAPLPQVAQGVARPGALERFLRDRGE